MIDKTKIDQNKMKTILETHLKREAKPDELNNAFTDTNLILEYLLDEIDDVKKWLK